MRYPVLTCLISVTIMVSSLAADDTGTLREKKSELDGIKQRLIETRQKADSLNRLESKLQQTISGYSDRVNRNRKLINKTEKQLSEVRGELQKNNEVLETTEERLKQKRDNYIGLLKDFYRKRRAYSGLEMWNFDQVMSEKRMVHYLASVSGRTTSEIVRTDDSLKMISQQVDSLRQTDSDLEQLRREKKNKVNLDLALKEKEETSLGNVRRQSNLLQERLETLSDAARRMEDIIAELERQQERRREEMGISPRFSAADFAVMKGSLLPPIRGRIISAFGWKKDKITNLSSFSPGIDIRPSPGHKEVFASAPGRVVYVGSLRGYNNFVIIEHDDDYYTTYAGLESVNVELDELLNTGDKIGVPGGDKVHFEIRRGRDHLDPVIWLDLNEF